VETGNHKKTGSLRTPEINQVALVMSQLARELNGNKKPDGSHFDYTSGVVPYGLGLSNLIDDFQALRTLMNSRNWKSVF